MKILKHRNLLGCLFAVILAMPLIQVGVRCAYTIFNKNAKDSYSDFSTETLIDIQEVSEINTGEKYYFNGTLNSSLNSTGSQLNIMLFIDNVDVQYSYYSWFTTDVKKITLYLNNNTSRVILYAFDSDNITLGSATIDNYFAINFTFDLINYYIANTDNLPYFYPFFFTYSMVSNGNTLDNAFEYSINKITEGNNIGDLHFFTWFADLFLDLDNSVNALYINFINWYFNYALLVSVVYILFLVLMWFIQFVRKLLEKGLDFGQRGY